MQKEIPVQKTLFLPDSDLASDSCISTEDVDKKCKTSRSIRPLPPLKPGEATQKEIPVPKTLFLPEDNLASDNCKSTEDVDKKCKTSRSVSSLPPVKSGEAMQKEIPVPKTLFLPEDNLASKNIDSCMQSAQDVDKKFKTSRSVSSLPPVKSEDRGQCNPDTLTERFLPLRANMVTKVTKSYQEQTCQPEFEDLLDGTSSTRVRSTLSNNRNDMANHKLNANHTTTQVAKRPSSVSYEVQSIAVDEETRVILSDNNRTVYKAILTDTTSQSVKNTLLQKFVTLDPDFDLPQCSWKLHPSQHSIKKELAKTLDISAKYIDNVWVEQNKLFAQDTTEDQISNNSSIRSQSPIFPDHSTPSSPMSQSIPPSLSRINTTPTLEHDTTATETSNITAPSSDSITCILTTRMSLAVTLLFSSASEILPSL